MTISSLQQVHIKVLKLCVSVQPSIKNEDATISDMIIVIISITVFMLLDGCKKQKDKSQRRSPTASTHLIICLSLSLHFPCLLIHQAIIISVSLQSHPSLSFSITHLLSLLIFCSSPDTISGFFYLSLSSSSLSFPPKHCCQSLVISCCVFVVSSVSVPCFNVTQLARSHNGC